MNVGKNADGSIYGETDIIFCDDQSPWCFVDDFMGAPVAIDGWQLYEPCDAPKPESATEPCEVCDGIGMVSCEACNATGRVPISQPTYKVGDWVTDGVVSGCVSELCGSECLWIDATDGVSYHINTTNARRLNPSEIIVMIGCLSGTVEKASDYEYFLLWHSRTDCDYSMIKWSALDPATRKLVERLLKAQEEK